MSERFTLVLSRVLAALAFAAPGIALAQYPERPIRIIVPSGAGSAPDIITRIIVVETGRQMGQTFVVDNRAGAAGSIGTDLIAKAPPDGYTLGIGNILTLALNRSVLPKLPYDPDSLVPVVQHAFVPSMLAVTRSLPVRSIEELVEHARRSPGKLLFASSSNASSGHVGGELFKLLTRTDMVHVPFKGSAFAIADLTAGRVHLMIENVPAIGPHVKSGALRGLAVTSAKRVPAYSELPTVAEAGVSGFEITAWGGMIVPSGMPKPIVQRLNAEVNRTLALPQVREKLTALGAEIVGGTPEAFGDHIRKETAKWAEVVKRAGVKVD